MKIIKRIFLTSLLITLVGFIVSAIRVYNFAGKTETMEVDAAIVLGAAVFGNEPSPVLQERINHAITLYEQGHVKVIIFTGGRGPTGNESEGKISALYALENGVPEEAILIEDTSTSTYENLYNAYQVGLANNLDSYLIVSTPYHMKRAMEITTSLGLEAYSSPTRSIQWINWFTKTRAFIREVILYEVYLVTNILS